MNSLTDSEAPQEASEQEDRQIFDGTRPKSRQRTTHSMSIDETIEVPRDSKVAYTFPQRQMVSAEVSALFRLFSKS